MEGYNRVSKYGSKRITDALAHVIEADTIEIIANATFTLLEEAGNPITDTSKTAQVDTVTLTGTGGTGLIADTVGLRKAVEWNTSLTQTAADFVTAYAATYATYGIGVTSSGADIIFTAQSAGEGFASPVFVAATGDLGGTTVNTTANVQSAIAKHGIVAVHPAGEKIYASTKFKRVKLSAGTITVY